MLTVANNSVGDPIFIGGDVIFLPRIIIIKSVVIGSKVIDDIYVSCTIRNCTSKQNLFMLALRLN